MKDVMPLLFSEFVSRPILRERMGKMRSRERERSKLTEELKFIFQKCNPPGRIDISTYGGRAIPSYCYTFNSVGSRLFWERHSDLIGRSRIPAPVVFSLVTIKLSDVSITPRQLCTDQINYDNRYSTTR